MQTKEQTAKKLARVHYGMESGLKKVIRILGTEEQESDPREPVKILQVHKLTVPAGIIPIPLGRHPEIGQDHPVLLVEITPGEYRQLLRGELHLPEGWRLGAEILKPKPRPRNGKV